MITQYNPDLPVPRFTGSVPFSQFLKAISGIIEKSQEILENRDIRFVN